MEQGAREQNPSIEIKTQTLVASPAGPNKVDKGCASTDSLFEAAFEEGDPSSQTLKAPSAPSPKGRASSNEDGAGNSVRLVNPDARKIHDISLVPHSSNVNPEEKTRLKHELRGAAREQNAHVESNDFDATNLLHALQADGKATESTARVLSPRLKQSLETQKAVQMDPIPHSTSQSARTVRSTSENHEIEIPKTFPSSSPAPFNERPDQSSDPSEGFLKSASVDHFEKNQLELDTPSKSDSDSEYDFPEVVPMSLRSSMSLDDLDSEDEVGEKLPSSKLLLHTADWLERDMALVPGAKDIEVLLENYESKVESPPVVGIAHIAHGPSSIVEDLSTPATVAEPPSPHSINPGAKPGEEPYLRNALRRLLRSTIKLANGVINNFSRLMKRIFPKKAPVKAPVSKVHLETEFHSTPDHPKIEPIRNHRLDEDVPLPSWSEVIHMIERSNMGWENAKKILERPQIHYETPTPFELPKEILGPESLMRNFVPDEEVQKRFRKLPIPQKPILPVKQPTSGQQKRKKKR